jgi:hypothetical protein
MKNGSRIEVLYGFRFPRGACFIRAEALILRRRLKLRCEAMAKPSIKKNP